MLIFKRTDDVKNDWNTLDVVSPDVDSGEPIEIKKTARQLQKDGVRIQQDKWCETLNELAK